jgi:hypothetical protein
MILIALMAKERLQVQLIEEDRESKPKVPK